MLILEIVSWEIWASLYESRLLCHSVTLQLNVVCTNELSILVTGTRRAAWDAGGPAEAGHALWEFDL
jgi:hypothetical protein